MKYKKTLIWLVIVIAVAFGGYKYFFTKTPVTVYTTEDVVRGNLSQTVSSTGEFKSDENITLSFKTSGKIESMNVSIGDKVTKGQKLAVIERGILNEQLRQSEADIRAQKKTVSDMVDKKDTTTVDQRDAQRAIVQKLEASRDAVLRQISETRMVASMAGTVTDKKADVGEIVMAGSPVITIANPENLIIESNIPESDIVKIAVGQTAKIVFDALTPEDIFTAAVVEIDPASTVIQDVVYYRVKLKVDKLDALLKIGMSCDVDIATAEKNDVLIIPQRAVKIEGSKQYVEILNADGITVKKVYVETGLSGDNGMVEVKNSLQAGEKVVTFTKTQ